MGDINHLAVFVAALAVFAFGMLWYSPILFGKRWAKLAKVKRKKKKGSWKAAVAGFVSKWIMAYVLLIVVRLFGARSVGAGMSVGFWMWLGFIATITFSGVIWDNKPVKLWLMKNAYYLIMMVFMGALLAVWM